MEPESSERHSQVTCHISLSTARSIHLWIRIGFYNEPNIVNIIKSSTLRWAGHVVRMDDNELPKKILWTNPGSQRGHGRLNSRWIDRVEEDARKLGCRNWLADARIRVAGEICSRRSRVTQGYRADADDKDNITLCVSCIMSWKSAPCMVSCTVCVEEEVIVVEGYWGSTWNVSKGHKVSTLLSPPLRIDS
jgi:hypothetical protein